MFYPNNIVEEKVKTAPKLPGCYIYRDTKAKVIYVGKAVNISNRVKSYFVSVANHEPKIQKLVRQIHDVEFVTTDSELEALILETNLIKKYKPKYNSFRKDDKMYIWIMLDGNEDFPRFRVVREKKKKNARYFGPYPSKMPLERILRSLRKVFPFRSCDRQIDEVISLDENGNKVRTIKSSDPKPCLYYYLKLCNAPCAGLVSKKEYSKEIKNLQLFLRSKKDSILQNLEEQMKELSTSREYEQAAKIRDKIKDLHYISQRVHIEDINTDESAYRKAKQDREKTALLELIDKLQFDNLKIKENFKIECYDISNIQGTNAVASMVVFVDAKPRKNLYRKFKIKSKSTPDDFAMMQEVFKRRFGNIAKHSDDPSFSVLPDLIVVDGGKGQLSSAYKILTTYFKNIPICGLAKRFEEIFVISEAEGELVFKKKTLPFGSEMRFLMQRIRDESHRFAIKYHRNLRRIAQTVSVLDDIPGIGKLTKQKLLKAFGSLDGIKAAKDSDIQTIIKNKTTIRNLRKLL